MRIGLPVKRVNLPEGEEVLDLGLAALRGDVSDLNGGRHIGWCGIGGL